ncbi:hypothetical protein CAOG_06900 [Capsaspora owczarzaki ATCC 30864]|uniref:Uncharacterized protein n=1 Tax=Capsaspora owczarzaki (strain ATCC 30864) TaxID=595528 RepID=A0A0D2WV47_CAPO3|nr:hypothetical protein CAOG_06900 [Capsaspora owczarzaki ATCC 30864]KJE96600.1 hypothetical protein CAOG_006900 [Capsaspora owczarzaki ATCC 30864]|eukprot:XP_004344521.1 hypothetical protein CAOG_06900 [Capsaspora owczarzaki ATCC 30864]
MSTRRRSLGKGAAAAALPAGTSIAHYFVQSSATTSTARPAAAEPQNDEVATLGFPHESPRRGGNPLLSFSAGPVIDAAGSKTSFLALSSKSPAARRQAAVESSVQNSVAIAASSVLHDSSFSKPQTKRQLLPINPSVAPPSGAALESSSDSRSTKHLPDLIVLDAPTREQQAADVRSVLAAAAPAPNLVVANAPSERSPLFVTAQQQLRDRALLALDQPESLSTRAESLEVFKPKIQPRLLQRARSTRDLPFSKRRRIDATGGSGMDLDDDDDDEDGNGVVEWQSSFATAPRVGGVYTASALERLSTVTSFASGDCQPTSAADLTVRPSKERERRTTPVKQSRQAIQQQPAACPATPNASRASKSSSSPMSPRTPAQRSSSRLQTDTSLPAVRSSELETMMSLLHGASSSLSTSAIHGLSPPAIRGGSLDTPRSTRINKMPDLTESPSAFSFSASLPDSCSEEGSLLQLWSAPLLPSAEPADGASSARPPATTAAAVVSPRANRTPRRAASLAAAAALVPSPSLRRARTSTGIKSSSRARAVLPVNSDLVMSVKQLIQSSQQQHTSGGSRATLVVIPASSSSSVVETPQPSLSEASSAMLMDSGCDFEFSQQQLAELETDDMLSDDSTSPNAADNQAFGDEENDDGFQLTPELALAIDQVEIMSQSMPPRAAAAVYLPVKSASSTGVFASSAAPAATAHKPPTSAFAHARNPSASSTCTTTRTASNAPQRASTRPPSSRSTNATSSSSASSALPRRICSQEEINAKKARAFQRLRERGLSQTLSQ